MEEETFPPEENPFECFTKEIIWALLTMKTLLAASNKSIDEE
jgi:hypothetical protein